MLRAGRVRLLSVCLLLGWVLLLGRAFQVQVVQGSYWAERARERQGDIEPLAASRGRIVGADGVVLAHSVPNRSLAVDPARVEDAAALAGALASIGLVDSTRFLRELDRSAHRRFLWIDRGLIPERDLQPVLDRFPELTCSIEGKRIYPMGPAGGSVVGVVGRDTGGLSGLESRYDGLLRGVDGKMLDISDRTGRRFPGLERTLLEAPRPGHSLRVTLHSQIQEIASAHLHQAVEKDGAKGGFVIVTRPGTGEVLAMATAPAPDPHTPDDWTEEQLRINAVADAFEPGSVYKLVAFAAALESGRLSPEEEIDCMDGVRPVPGGRPIRDHDPYGILPAWEVMAHSSNIGTGLIAERVGAEGFYRMEKSLGFGLPTDIGLPGEGRGWIPEPSAWSKRSLVTQAFGQEVSCTGIQLAMAFGVVANGGHLMQPLLVREVRSADGATVERHEPVLVRQVLRPVVARTLRLLLRGVVEQGTGGEAEVEGYPTAGKTATAQKYIQKLESYSKEKYVAAFCGFAPWDDPDVVCVVVIDEPQSSIWGGSVAAPVFREIVQDIRPLLARAEAGEPLVLAPESWHAGERAVHRTVPGLRGLSARVAGRVVTEAGFQPRMSGVGSWVESTEPAAGTALVEGGVVTLRLGDPAEHVMPDLSGLSLRDALLRIRSLEAVPVVEGAGWVASQHPEPGEKMEPGVVCRIRLDTRSSEAWKEYEEFEERAARDLAARADLGEPATRHRDGGR